MFAPDLVGTSEQIAERLHAHAGFQAVDEVAFALPFTFEHDDYVQILTDMADAAGAAAGLVFYADLRNHTAVLIHRCVHRWG